MRDAGEHRESDDAKGPTTAIAMDLDRALATLADDVRLCIVLAYHERMTHKEIAEFMGIPLGTVKSHVRRGTQKLQQELAAYMEPRKEAS